MTGPAMSATELIALSEGEVGVLLWQTWGVSSSIDSAAAAEPLVDVAACCPGLGEGTLTQLEAEAMVSKLKALADPVRLRLINAIAQSGEACACDLPSLLDRSQPTVSHHLKVLVEAELLTREQRGKWAWFSVRADQLQALGAAFQVPAGA